MKSLFGNQDGALQTNMMDHWVHHRDIAGSTRGECCVGGAVSIYRWDSSLFQPRPTVS